jgi:hypothetical protein
MAAQIDDDTARNNSLAPIEWEQVVDLFEPPMPAKITAKQAGALRRSAGEEDAEPEGDRAETIVPVGHGA